jgi:hypothetical protein
MRAFARRRIAAVAVAVTVGLMAPAVGSAAATVPTVTTVVSTGSSTTSSTVPRNRGVSPLRAYRLALKAYNKQRKAINDAFRTAVLEAKSTFFAALVAAKSPAARSTARAALALAIAQATATRSAALTALGPPPVAP